KELFTVGGTDPVEPMFERHSVSSALFSGMIASEPQRGASGPYAPSELPPSKRNSNSGSQSDIGCVSPYLVAEGATSLEYPNLAPPLLSYFGSITENLTGYSDSELIMAVYCEAPEYNRKQADKYLKFLQECKTLKGNNLKHWIKAWNANSPGYQTSYKSVLRARQALEEEGIVGLLGNYGKNYGKSVVKDSWFEEFKKLYLLEGAPSLQSSWVILLGKLKRLEDITLKDFPKPISFLRRLEREIPEQAIYKFRYGEKAWNKKYNMYIDRDYSNVKACQCWVSDHAQIDVAVKGPDGKIYFPWVTAWRDFKTSKWLGWLLHFESPNSDHIFQSFYYAALVWGLPEEIYIDNGKDYRSKDFAGGRPKKIKVEINVDRAASMINLIGVIAHFSNPYGAQSKPIERDFNKIKEMLSKHCVGYRGGNVVERPEKLVDEIKTGLVVEFDKFKDLFDYYIANVLNRMPSTGKNLQGMSPDQLWAEAYTEKRKPSKDELRLFCMRCSNVVSITRNGIRDTRLKVTYYEPWMERFKGTKTKVYFRRDINAYQECWVFEAKTDRYMGKGIIQGLVPALVKTDLDKKRLEKASKLKANARKYVNSHIPEGKTDLSELILDAEAGAKMLAGETKEANPKVTKISKTEMAEALEIEKHKNDGNKENIEMLKAINEHQLKKKAEEVPIFLTRREAEEYRRQHSA
ncbi:MAG: hypothetical protein HY817_01415, partial [Candidatus Abawacabacteria bacterium]|nr:hypothetical protein [Candidatus Abawacabacteria bacterium]